MFLTDTSNLGLIRDRSSGGDGDYGRGRASS